MSLTNIFFVFVGNVSIFYFQQITFSDLNELKVLNTKLTQRLHECESKLKEKDDELKENKLKFKEMDDRLLVIEQSFLESKKDLHFHGNTIQAYGQQLDECVHECTKIGAELKKEVNDLHNHLCILSETNPYFVWKIKNFLT